MNKVNNTQGKRKEQIYILQIKLHSSLKSVSMVICSL